jgi:hypothetical protein
MASRFRRIQFAAAIKEIGPAIDLPPTQASPMPGRLCLNLRIPPLLGRRTTILHSLSRRARPTDLR